MKGLIPASLYEKYEAQLLQGALETMQDVVWCPRCEYPATLVSPEEEGQGGRLALCGKCAFSFCSECRAGWHGLAPCANLAVRWRNADEEGRAALRAKHGERAMEEVESAQWVLENTKPCPKCGTGTEKNGGCNHMDCRKCGYSWCWLCGRRCDPGHYREGSGCVQFSEDFWEEIRAAEREARGAGAHAEELHPAWDPGWEPDPEDFGW